MRIRVSILGLVNLSLATMLTACFVYPAKRIAVNDIAIETKETTPLKIDSARTFLEENELGVEGIVSTCHGEQGFVRGSVTVVALSDSGNNLAKKTDCSLAMAPEANLRVQGDQTFIYRRFDIKLGISPSSVSKIVVVPNDTSANCK